MEQTGNITGWWWFGTWLLFFHIYIYMGIIIPTNSYFQRGRYTTHQIMLLFMGKNTKYSGFRISQDSYASMFFLFDVVRKYGDLHENNRFQMCISKSILVNYTFFLWGYSWIYIYIYIYIYPILTGCLVGLIGFIIYFQN